MRVSKTSKESNKRPADGMTVSSVAWMDRKEKRARVHERRTSCDRELASGNA